MPIEACVARGGVTDIFFSYRSVDRERVRLIHDAFAKQGFEVFWDQEVPSGVDWDTWIRQHLSKSKCAVVFWSTASVESDNVRHEAIVAKRQGKLIPILLETLTPDQFPMGLYSQQAINFAGWNGNFEQAEWHELLRAVETKLIPPWMQRKVDELEAELVAERARREGVENRDKVLQARIAKEAQAQGDLKRERDEAIDETVALKARIQELNRTRSELEVRAGDLTQLLKAAESVSQRDQESIWIPGFFSFETAGVLVIAIVTAFLLGYAMHSFYSSSPPNSTAAVEPYAGPGSPASATGFFTIRSSTEAYGDAIAETAWFESINECEQSCRNLAKCNVFTYAKDYRSCFLYSNARVKPSTLFDTGLRK